MNAKTTAMRLHPVMEGSILLESTGGCALFGCPSEVLKEILEKKLPIPHTVVLPEMLHKGQSSQAAIEFLFFYYLFFYNGIEKHGKFRIFATHSQCRNLKEAMRIAILGPSEKEMRKGGMTKRLAEQLSRELYYLAPPNPQTNLPYDMEEMFEWNILSKNSKGILFPGKDRSSEFQIQQKGKTTFEVNGAGKSALVDISIRKIQSPPYEINHKPVTVSPDQLTVTVLGASDGFDPKAPANGYLFNFNGRLGIWDCPSYLHQHLQKMKIDFDQIEALFLSHVHEDHIDPVESIRKNNPVELYCTPEVYYSLLLKIMTVMDCSMDDAKTFHHWHPIGVDKVHDIIGAKFDFFYSIHALPTVGCRISVGPENSEKSILISSDHAAFWMMRDMKRDGVLTEKRFNASTQLIKGHEDLILIDVGGGTIHGNYEDYVDIESTIHFMHIGELPKLPENKFLVKHADIIDLNLSS
ncbi:MAG: hypothetical protein HQM13_20100 [SAR324 cluster bacterium]|nr:hypothetical protein [SAR324 cluster bacterium]